MSAPSVPRLTLADIQQFLYREARLADEHDYDGWEALWTDDGVYWVPANGDDIDPTRQMSVIHDNRRRIATRIKQLKTGRRHAQVPTSRLRRVVSNVEILGVEDGGDTVVGANFVLVESRERGTELWAGRYTYRLRRAQESTVEAELRMAFKKVALVDNARVLPTLAFLI
jgi:3-phenylpropionate/cinnamic acid dioxygenase small subunit